MFIEKSKQPLISVIVPIYKVEAYLDRCISSIVQQTYYNLEIILVNDGSPDKCGEICDRWAEQDSRIHVIHKENGGLSDARNTGIEKAAGEYMAFIDSDDYIEPEMFERLLDAMIRTTSKMAVCNYVYEFERENEYAKQSSPENYQIQWEMQVSCQELFKLMQDGKYTFGEAAWNKLYQKSIFESVRYPLGKIHEDEYVFHRIVYQCEAIICIPYVGYHYLQRQGSIMASRQNLYNMMEAIMDRCQYFIEKNEQELAVISEKRLLGVMKHAKKDNVINKNDVWLKRYTLIIWKLFRKCWISPIILCKRFVRFYFL